MSDDPRPRPVTRADVARYAGVSTAVVSYVLNDGPKAVAPLTKERVLDAVRVLGYRPNLAARALSKGQADMLGLLVSDNGNPFFTALWHALDRASAARSRQLLIVNSDRTQTSTSDQIRDLASRQISGLVIANILTAGEQALVENLGIPSVMIGQFGDIDGMSGIGVDFVSGARQGVEHLIGHGYRDIAFVGSVSRHDGRERGWREALTAAQLSPGPLLHTTFSYEGGYDAGQRLLRDGTLPRGILAASDQIALGLLTAMREAGVRVPEDVALVSFDGTSAVDYVWPRMTTVVQPLEAMADAAIAALVEPDTTPRFVEFGTELRVRESCGCPTIR